MAHLNTRGLPSQHAYFSNGVVELGNLAQAIGHPRNNFVGQSKPVNKGCVMARLFCSLKVFCVLKCNDRALCLNGICQVCKYGVLLRGTGPCHSLRCTTGAQAHLV